MKLALGDLVTKSDKRILSTAVAPPPIQRVRYTSRHLEVESRETRRMGADGPLRFRPRYEKCVVGQEQRAGLHCRYRLPEREPSQRGEKGFP